MRRVRRRRWQAVSESVVSVRCYSGHTYAQEPRSLVWQGKEHVVASVKSVRRVLKGETVLVVFSVETTGRMFFQLSYDESTDTWSAAERVC